MGWRKVSGLDVIRELLRVFHFHAAGLSVCSVPLALGGYRHRGMEKLEVVLEFVRMIKSGFASCPAADVDIDMAALMMIRECCRVDRCDAVIRMVRRMLSRIMCTIKMVLELLLVGHWFFAAIPATVRLSWGL